MLGIDVEQLVLRLKIEDIAVGDAPLALSGADHHIISLVRFIVHGEIIVQDAAQGRAHDLLLIGDHEHAGGAHALAEHLAKAAAVHAQDDIIVPVALHHVRKKADAAPDLAGIRAVHAHDHQHDAAFGLKGAPELMLASGHDIRPDRGEFGAQKAV